MNEQNNPQIEEMDRDKSRKGASKKSPNRIFILAAALILTLTSAGLTHAKLRTFMSTKGMNNAAISPTAKAMEATESNNGIKNASSPARPAGNVHLKRPACANCPFILDNCERNGWKPAAVCTACAIGNCYVGPN